MYRNVNQEYIWSYLVEYVKQSVRGLPKKGVAYQKGFTAHAQLFCARWLLPSALLAKRRSTNLQHRKPARVKMFD
jgi:hypothetical protein